MVHAQVHATEDVGFGLVVRFVFFFPVGSHVAEACVHAEHKEVVLERHLEFVFDGDFEFAHVVAVVALEARSEREPVLENRKRRSYRHGVGLFKIVRTSEVVTQLVPCRVFEIHVLDQAIPVELGTVGTVCPLSSDLEHGIVCADRCSQIPGVLEEAFLESCRKERLLG